MNDNLTALPHVAARMFGVPLLVEPSKGQEIAAGFAGRVFGGGAVTVDGAAVSGDFVPTPRAGSVLLESLTGFLIEEKTGYAIHNGVAVIEVIGSLVRRGSYVGQSSGTTSYEGLRAQFKAAAADDRVKAIALELDSPGGEAAGCFELAALLREVREQKPVYAFLSETACSGAYAIASQANLIVAPKYGAIGSIGVIVIHTDHSKALQNAGISATVIRAGEDKARGNPFEPLPDGLRDEWQATCEQMRVDFAQTVADGRGARFSVAAAIKTEAAVYDGETGKALGLCDVVADPKEAFDAMVAAVNSTGVWAGDLTVNASAVPNHGSGCDNAAQGVGQSEKGEQHMENETDVQPDAAKAGAKTATDTNKGRSMADTAKIMGLCSKAGMSIDEASAFLQSDKSVETIQGEIIDHMAAKSADGGDINGRTSVSITSGGDAVERMQAGMVEALSAKTNLVDKKSAKGNEFVSMSLAEMARHSLSVRGLSVTGGRQEMVGAAFVPSLAGGMHTGSDFGHVLATIASKSVLRGYDEAPEQFHLFTRAGTLTDFRPAGRVGLDAIGALDEVGEGAEYKFGKLGDHGATIMLATYGKLFTISRQAVINDDLDAFTRIPALMGAAAKRTVGNLVYPILTNNNYKGPDGKVLFSVANSNRPAAYGDPTIETVAAGIDAMSQQEAPGSTKDEPIYVNAEPRFIVAGGQNKSAVRSLLASKEQDDNSANPVYQAVEPIFDARMGQSWSLLADPNQFDTIEVAYLDGMDTPRIEQQSGWSVDGIEMKVAMDAGVSPLSHRGMWRGQ
jgi:signal peptide peptidase SppA